jgi:hypothetical protein
MYVVFVVLLLFVLPSGCVAVEALWRHGEADIVLLIGKWFVFWAVGVRLFIAGVRQVVQPQFTAESIFDAKDEASSAIVREIGFSNLAMGVLGLLTLVRPSWLVPGAIVGGLFYGLAGLGHAARGKRNSKEQVALVSDLLMFVLLGAFVAIRGF